MRRALRRIAPLLLLAGSPVLAGQEEVFHCEDERGRMTLSDRPCAQGLKFIGMRTIETYGSPSRLAPGADNRASGGQQRSAAARATVPQAGNAAPAKKADCKPKDDSPWLNPIGKGDC